MGTLTSTSPTTGEVLATWPTFTAEQVDAAVRAAHAAAISWRTTDWAQRTALLEAVADELTARRRELAALMTDEMGKPVAEALAEIDKCAWTTRFYAEKAPEFLADRVVETPAARSWVSHEPVGVVLAVMPWNFPFWQVVRFAAPALAAGNAALLKHAPSVTGCALAAEEVFRAAAAAVGAPEALFTTLLVDETEVAEATARIIEHPLVAAVTLTGSERAGAAVAAVAARAIKKSVLELGGSDPFVVLDDADVALAARMAVRSRFLNSGQSCLAAKRFIVADSIADEFTHRFGAAVAELTVGDPHDPSTQVGPLARVEQVTAIERQVDESVAAGATVVTGGKRLEEGGAFFAPTVLADVTSEMAVFREETFGPVAAVIRAVDDDHAARLADDSPFGLGASVWSRDVDRALAVGRRITSGALFVNAVVASDARLPFGGTRRSGYGRELSEEGIREFTNVRSVWIGAEASAPEEPVE
ncbi:aldehyde dehydrogenase family protein [Modestobacter altitudinis]|uniref:aldehyde dehydrogenase family protein n=1 Tax=Modestobacter altitudinis TaxID=2213158 RepID=UPI001FECBA72|nr:aldehyde dehydrogenase family protein [Modestobacter altitudinis]